MRHRAAACEPPAPHHLGVVAVGPLLASVYQERFRKADRADNDQCNRDDGVALNRQVNAAADAEKRQAEPEVLTEFRVLGAGPQGNAFHGDAVR